MNEKCRFCLGEVCPSGWGGCPQIVGSGVWSPAAYWIVSIENTLCHHWRNGGRLCSVRLNFFSIVLKIKFGEWEVNVSSWHRCTEMLTCRSFFLHMHWKHLATWWECEAGFIRKETDRFLLQCSMIWTLCKYTSDCRLILRDWFTGMAMSYCGCALHKGGGMPLPPPTLVYISTQQCLLHSLTQMCNHLQSRPLCTYTVPNALNSTGGL